MADGTSKPIQEVHVGDRVANEVAGSDRTEQHVVTAVHVPLAQLIDIVRLHGVAATAGSVRSATRAARVRIRDMRWAS